RVGFTETGEDADGRTSRSRENPTNLVSLPNADVLNFGIRPLPLDPSVTGDHDVDVFVDDVVFFRVVELGVRPGDFSPAGVRVRLFELAQLRFNDTPERFLVGKQCSDLLRSLFLLLELAANRVDLEL